MSRKFAKFFISIFALAGMLALSACGDSPKVFNYGTGTPNITVDQR